MCFHLTPTAALIHFSLSGSHYGYGWFIKYLYETALAFCPALHSKVAEPPFSHLRPSLAPHFLSSACLPSHVLANDAKSSMLNATSQLCHWCWSGLSCLPSPPPQPPPPHTHPWRHKHHSRDDESTALGAFTAKREQTMWAQAGGRFYPRQHQSRTTRGPAENR